MDDRIFGQDRYTSVMAEIFSEIKKLGTLKGGEYSGDIDRLANFRRNAHDVGLQQEVVWRIYAGKHWDAITQYVQDLNKGVERERLETIGGRIDDLVLYLVLFKCMLIERNDGPTKSPTKPSPDLPSHPEHATAKAIVITALRNVGRDENEYDRATRDAQS